MISWRPLLTCGSRPLLTAVSVGTSRIEKKIRPCRLSRNAICGLCGGCLLEGSANAVTSRSFGMPTMIGVEEVKVHPEAGCSDWSEPQSVEREEAQEAASESWNSWSNPSPCALR